LPSSKASLRIARKKRSREFIKEKGKEPLEHNEERPSHGQRGDDIGTDADNMLVTSEESSLIGRGGGKKVHARESKRAHGTKRGLSALSGGKQTIGQVYFHPGKGGQG